MESRSARNIDTRQEPALAEQDAAGSAPPRIALVHDCLYFRAGSEQVLGEMLEVFPQADVFGLFDFLPEKERSFLKGKRVHTSFLQHMPFMRSRHRLYLPLMPLAVENLDVSAYDLVISNSHLAAKGVITGPNQLHICYCHTPARFAWDLQNLYFQQMGLRRGRWGVGGVRGMIARLILHYFRAWDVRSSHGVDMFLSNSQYVRRRIEKTYRRDATPIYPPVACELFPLHSEKQDYYVTVSRMVPYKRMDLIVQAFSRMKNRRLVVIGEGPELTKIRRLAKLSGAAGNIEILGWQPHAVMCRHLQQARGFVFAAEEDFGIAPVEAQACGTPVIAFGRGGVTESVVPGVTGIFYPRQTVEDLVEAVERFKTLTWDPAVIRRNAEKFSRDAFRRNFRYEVETAWALFQNRLGQVTGDSLRPPESHREMEGRPGRERGAGRAPRDRVS